MKISGSGLDTGGHRTKSMYAYCKARTTQRIFALKGANTANAPITNKTIKQMIPNELTLFSVGVTVIKDDFYANLGITEQGANFCHFPDKPVYNDKYFKMLTAEKRDDKGKYVKVRLRNEALDCRVYARVVLAIMQINVNTLPRPVIFIGEEDRIKYSPRKKEQYKESSSHLDEF